MRRGRPNRAAEKIQSLLQTEEFNTQVINANVSDDPSDPALQLASKYHLNLWDTQLLASRNEADLC